MLGRQMESSPITFLTIYRDVGKKVKPVDVKQASDIELFEIVQENSTPQARLYGSALMELCRRLEIAKTTDSPSEQNADL